MSQFDLMLDFKMKVDQCDLYFTQFSDFALYLEDYLMYKHDILGIMCQYDANLEFRIKVCHCDLNFMVQ